MVRDGIYYGLAALVVAILLAWLTAPGWAIHNHSSNDESVYELTIQDSPLNIAMGSLLWQEDLSHPMEALGATGGFSTNREAVVRS